MKRIVSLLIALTLVLGLAACGSNGGGSSAASTPAESTPAESTPAESTPAESTPESTQPEAPADGAFDGKIAIVTNTVSQNEEEYRSAQIMVERYGADKVNHVTWPDNFMTEQEQMVSIVAKIAADPEVKALVLNQAVPGSNAAVDKLLETRDDIFIVYCTPQENPSDVAARANLIVMPDEFSMGTAMVEQAHAQGAKVFVHYSFPRHMSQILLSGRRDLIKEKCAELGIEFVDATAPDPTGESGTTGAQQFILEDVPKMVAEYGADTAFFSTNCSMQVPLIQAVVSEKAIYPQPCCPSPFHGFPAALGLESTDVGDIDAVVAATNAKIAEAGVQGRLSTWPVPAAMMCTIASAEYAVKWINGEVPQEGIDLEILKGCMKDYAQVDVTLNTYVEEGTEYPNFQQIIMGYLTYNG